MLRRNEIKSNSTFDLTITVPSVICPHFFFSIVSSVTLPIEQRQHQAYPTDASFHLNQRGRLQRGRQKTQVLISKTLALHVRYARALQCSFFVALYKTTTWNDQIRGFMQNVNTRRWISLSSLFSELEIASAILAFG